MAVKTGPLRWLLFAIGSLATVLGIAGIVLPLLPSTPFFLLAAACFARSSERAERWLLSNRIWGAQIREYRDHGTVGTRTKVIAIASIWVGMGVSAWLTGWNPVLMLVLGTVGLAVSLLLVRLPGTRIPELHP